MSSHYKKEVKVRKYKYYTDDDLFKCLEDVKSKKLTHNLKPGKPLFFFQIRRGWLCQMYHSIESFWISYR